MQNIWDEFLGFIILIISKYKELLLVLYGVIVVLGISWQWNLLRKDYYYRDTSYRYYIPEYFSLLIPHFIPKRVIVPYVFGIVVFVGTLILSSFELYTYGIFFSESDWVENVLKAGIFFLIIILKSWFGPLLLSVSISYAIYLLSHGELISWVPILQELIDWIFSSLPDAVYILYVFVVLLYSALSSIRGFIN